MANEFASIWSAVAASFSAMAALTIMFIHRRNMIDADSPEIVLDGWRREIRKVGETENDALTFNKIANVGKGSALHVYINATNIINKRPLTSFSTECISIIPSGKEFDIKGKISLWWKNVDKHGLLPIKITIYCWSTKGYRYDTVYNLAAVELNKNQILAGGEVAPGVILTTRSTKSRSVWKLKVNGYLSRFPAIGRFFKNND